MPNCYDPTGKLTPAMVEAHDKIARGRKQNPLEKQDAPQALPSLKLSNHWKIPNLGLSKINPNPYVRWVFSFAFIEIKKCRNCKTGDPKRKRWRINLLKNVENRQGI